MIFALIFSGKRYIQNHAKINQFKDKEYVWIMGTYGEFRDDGEEMTRF